MREEFDYIIVGSGAAGSVVAARIAEANKGSVCVLEAGRDNKKILVDIPAGFVRNLQNPAMMWQFKSEPTEDTSGRSVYLPQGKILGGSTSINGLVYNRGQASDFDHWASLGNPGWSYQDLLPYFRKSETFEHADSQYRGSTGPLRIGEREQNHPICDKFIEAAASVTGLPMHNDYNGASQAGSGYYQRFIHQGKRENIASRFLVPASSKHDITLMTNTLATHINFDNKQARSISCIRDGENIELFANREIIVCGGTVNSTTLLQRSGIGDATYLKQVGVQPVHDLAGVGENFQDHFFARMAFRLKDGSDSLNMQAKGWRLGREVFRWLRKKPSILAWSPSIAYAFLNSQATLAGELGSDARPDMQFVFSHGSYRPGRIYELDSFPAVTCGFTQQRPYSSGHIKINSPKFEDTPSVQPNYLQDERDKEIAIAGVKIARKIMSTDQFSLLVTQEQFPGNEIQSDAEILNFVRSTGNTGYHLVGTCKMGPASDDEAVVGPDLRVHGLENIRVIDASVMPTVTSSNTCAAAIMIAEKGADLIINGQQ